MLAGLRTMFGEGEAQVEAGLSVASTALLEHGAGAETALQGGVMGIITVLN